MSAREVTGRAFDLASELDWPGGRPELIPCLFSITEFASGEILVPPGRRQGSANLRVCQPARHGSVAPVPQLDSQDSSNFFHDQLHQRAGVEVHDRHRSAPLFADSIRDRVLGSRTAPASCARPPRLVRSRDHALLGEPLQIRSGVHPEKPSDGNTAIRDDDLVSLTGSRQPAAQVGSELGNRNIHLASVQMIGR